MLRVLAPRSLITASTAAASAAAAAAAAAAVATFSSGAKLRIESTTGVRAAVPPGEGEAYMDMTTYHAVADETLEAVQEAVETVCDAYTLDDVETDLSSGVLNLSFADGASVYVLNKQTPNQQLWLSSPLSGPMRFNLDTAASPASWVCHRSDADLLALLHTELKTHLDDASGQDIPFAIDVSATADLL